MPSTPAWRFDAVASPNDAHCAAVAASAPNNPYATLGYARARERLGATVYAFGVRAGDQYVGCYGVLRGRRLVSRTLEIQSMPTLPDDAADTFWRGLLAHCRTLGVWDLSIQSFGSTSSAIPELGPSMQRRQRREYVIDLGAAARKPSSNHLRNASKARKAGLVIRRTTDPSAATRHVELISASMQRRLERGEQVSVEQESESTRAVLHSGLAELVQAYDGEELRSSLCLLRAARGAYYQSAGTTPEGMSQGASHLVITEVIAMLTSEGLETFNMGGAGPESPGLQRFKEGFQPRPMELEAATLCLRSHLQQKMRTMLRVVRRAVDRA